MPSMRLCMEKKSTTATPPSLQPRFCSTGRLCRMLQLNIQLLLCNYLARAPCPESSPQWDYAGRFCALPRCEYPEIPEYCGSPYNAPKDTQAWPGASVTHPAARADTRTALMMKSWSFRSASLANSKANGHSRIAVKTTSPRSVHKPFCEVLCKR